MSRRRFAAAVVLTLSALTAGAQDAPHGQARAEARAPFDLRSLFALSPGVISDDENGIMVRAFSVEVVVAQITPDGKLIKACVNSEEAARRFLDKPVAQNAEAQEQ
jgi:hypothetical protein